jgi:glycosyltransferase involved in cell wall biosynthesis
VKSVLRLAAIGRRSAVSVQNDSDRRVLAEGFPRVRPIVLIPGSGVDLERFRPLPEPAAPVTCAQVSRMLTIKGVVDLVAAVRRVRAEGIDLRLILAGTPDPESRAALAEATLEDWARDPAIRWLRHVEDVRSVWSAAHIAVLASHGGEGVPKSLLEAAACGRPLVGTAVPGIADLVAPGRNGLLVAPQDADALAIALARLAGDAALRAEWGAAARASVDPERGEAAVARATAALYRALAGIPAADAGPAQPG